MDVAGEEPPGVHGALEDAGLGGGVELLEIRKGHTLHIWVTAMVKSPQALPELSVKVKNKLRPVPKKRRVLKFTPPGVHELAAKDWELEVL